MRFIMFRLNTGKRNWRSIIMLACTGLAACHLLNPVVRPGDVLFQDDFSRTDSGWDRYADDVYVADYVNGAYQMTLQATNMLVWSLPHLDFQDVLIRVEGVRTAGPSNNVYGVLCRYRDPENFIFFMIASDGYAGIGQYTEGQKELLNHETLLPTDAVADTDEINLIQAACIGEELTLWVNGELVAVTGVPDLSHGDVGVIVGTYDEGGVEIQFDNFSTLMP
jgi:hypothetical protein